jgi:hypothetical protein
MEEKTMAINGTTPIIIAQKYMYSGTRYTYNEKGEINSIMNDPDIDFSDINDLKTYHNIKKIKNGLPIPFALSELFGFMGVKENARLMSNVDYTNDILFSSQRGNSLSIDVMAKKGNPIVFAFLNLLQLFWNNMKTYRYDLSYFNDGIIIMNAKLGGLNIESVEGGDYYDINVVLDSGKNPFEENNNKDELIAGVLLNRVLGGLI